MGNLVQIENGGIKAESWFFRTRRWGRYELEKKSYLIGHPNLSPMISAVVSQRLATLYELQSVYSSEDLFNLYEVVLVKLHNENVEYKKMRKK